MFIVSLGDLWEAHSSYVEKQVAQVIVLVVIGLAAYVLRQTWKLVSWMVAYYRRLDRARRDVGRIGTPMGRREGKGVWLADAPIHAPKSYDYRTVAANAISIVTTAIKSVRMGVLYSAVMAELEEFFFFPDWPFWPRAS